MQDLIYNKYLYLWQDEIDYALDSLRTVLDEERMDRIEKYVEDFLVISNEKVVIEADNFVECKETEVNLGKIAYYSTCMQRMDYYRELTFKLKYWMYLIETESDDTSVANLSLIFIYSE